MSIYLRRELRNQFCKHPCTGEQSCLQHWGCNVRRSGWVNIRWGNRFQTPFRSLRPSCGCRSRSCRKSRSSSFQAWCYAGRTGELDDGLQQNDGRRCTDQTSVSPGRASPRLSSSRDYYLNCKREWKSWWVSCGCCATRWKSTEKEKVCNWFLDRSPYSSLYSHCSPSG